MPERFDYTKNQFFHTALARLKLSGLNEKDYHTLQLSVMSSAEVKARCDLFQPCAAIRIPYFDVHGEKLSPFPGWPQFYRLRYIEETVSFRQMTDKKIPRYAQEPNSGVCAYFPRMTEWQHIVHDPTVPLFITEGEFKAARGCKEGYPTIGLGGVFNYKSSKLGVGFLPELEEFMWLRRTVYVVFDSDAGINPNITIALNDLSEKLMQRGALPHWVQIPSLKDVDKTGLDDLLVIKPQNTFERCIQNATPLTLASRLWQLNEEVCFTKRSTLYIHKKDDTIISPSQCKEAFGDIWGPERKVRKDGSVSLVDTLIIPKWMTWALREKFWDVTYLPGAAKYIQSSDGRTVSTEVDNEELWWYNLWNGWGCEPRAGDVTPFLELVDHLFTDAEPEARMWFLQWLAYPVQYPGTKLSTAAVIHGVKQGTGKSLPGVYHVTDLWTQ